MALKQDPIKFAKRLLELMGGHEAGAKRLLGEHDESLGLWNQDSVLMGRLLRCHLFVEFYLDRYLEFKNPALGDLRKARLSFAQKIELADRPGLPENYLFAGIRRLNAIRNRIAHTLRAEITPEDRKAFLEIEPFAALRPALSEPGAPSLDSIDIVEEFSRYAGTCLRHFGSTQAALWEQALRESLSDDPALP